MVFIFAGAALRVRARCNNGHTFTWCSVNGVTESTSRGMKDINLKLVVYSFLCGLHFKQLQVSGIFCFYTYKLFMILFELPTTRFWLLGLTFVKSGFVNFTCLPGNVSKDECPLHIPSFILPIPPTDSLPSGSLTMDKRTISTLRIPEGLSFTTNLLSTGYV